MKVLLAAWLLFTSVPIEPPRASPAASPTAAAPASIDWAASIDAATALAKQRRVVVLIDATSPDCPPCRKMERRTWVDPRVAAWIAAHAVAVRFSTDLDRPRAVALGIEGVPCLIVLRDGRELDRAVGYQSAEELIAWLDGVLAGKKRIDAVRARAGARTGPRIDVGARLDLARELMQAGKLDEATEEYVWLWQNMLAHDPAYTGVRGSFMAADMGRLARRHPPARAAFEKLRSQAALSDLHDWFVLNEVVGDPAATLAWFDRARKDPALAGTMRRSAFRIEQLLEEAGRWADIAALYPHPLEEVENAHELLEATLRVSAGDPQMQATDRRMFADKIGLLHAALLAAGREGDALAVAQAAFKLEDSPSLRQTLVRAALRARQPRALHRAWAADPKLRAELEEALGTPPGRR